MKCVMLNLALSLCLLACGCATAVGADVMERPSSSLEDTVSGPGWSGSVRWEQGSLEVTARGVARPGTGGGLARAEVMALKAARYLGYAKLLELLQGVRLDASRSWGWLESGRPELKGRVRGLVRGARVVSENVKHMPDGSVLGLVRLRLELAPLARQGARVYLEPEKGAKPKAASVPDEGSPPESEAGGNEVSSGSGPDYTGLIVVASGLGARPAMFPQVVDARDGREIFGPGVIDRGYAIEKGVVGYAPSLAKAQLQKRVGPHPLVVKAVRAEGLNKARLVLPAKEAARVLAADRRGRFLRRCGVVIVIE